MRQFIIFLILFFLSLYISAQEIPDSPNAYDLDSNRIGLWTILFDSDWKSSDIIDSVTFYRIINYKKGVSSVKVTDFYLNGNKQFEGNILSDKQEDIYFGKCEWFSENGDVIEKRIINEKTSEHFHYDQKKLLLKFLLEYDTLISYELYIKDTLSFPLFVRN